MRVTLLHNASAGDGHPTAGELIALLTQAGYSTLYGSAKHPEAIDLLAEPTEMVVVAGGDGTVARIIKNMPDRAVPVAILPLGTANNIARWLGIQGTPEQLVPGWRTARKQPLDIGATSGPCGQWRFVEALGFGAVAQAIARSTAVEQDGDDSLQLGRKALRAVLAEAATARLEVAVDGRSLPDDLLLVEIMNIGQIGPRLILAPQADPGDRILDVVYLEAARREEMLSWLEAAPENTWPPVGIVRGRQATVVWESSPARLDDVFPYPVDRPGSATVALEEEPVQVLVPATPEQPSHG